MKYKHDEIYFTSRKKALAVLPWLRDQMFVLHVCARCGINFASKEPSTDTGGIICQICEREIDASNSNP